METRPPTPSAPCDLGEVQGANFAVIHSFFIHCLAQLLRPALVLAQRRCGDFKMEDGLRSSLAWIDSKFSIQPAPSQLSSLGPPPGPVFPLRQPVAGASWGQLPGVPVLIDCFPPQALRPVAGEDPKCSGTRRRVCFVRVEFLDGAHENLNRSVGVEWEKP